MKKLPLLLLTLVASALLAGPAAAQSKTPGVDISYNQCAANVASAQDMTFPCNDDAADIVIIGSFVPPAAPDSMVALSGEECYMDLISASADLPPWWHLETGGCRDGNLLMACQKGIGQTGCTDYWGTNSAGGFQYLPNYPTASYNPLPNSARISSVFARPAGTLSAVTSFREYYAFRIDLTTGKTTTSDPNGQCTGCDVPVCFVLNEVLLTQAPGLGDHTMITPSQPGKNMITWQGGTGANCQLVPTKRTSWGQVKSLYR